jgi:hypothetical protein
MCETIIRYTRLLIGSHLVGGVEKVRKSYGRYFDGVVDLVQRTHVTSLVFSFFLNGKIPSTILKGWIRPYFILFIQLANYNHTN